MLEVFEAFVAKTKRQSKALTKYEQPKMKRYAAKIAVFSSFRFKKSLREKTT